MDTRQLEYFLSVAELLNFTKAAEKFYISQTAISQQIKSLEESLGVQLLIRNSRKVVLTPAGETFYKEAKFIVQQMDTAIKNTIKTASGYKGKLRIGFIRGNNIPSLHSLLCKFHSQFPEIDITFTDDNIENLCEQLSNKSLDLIFSIDFNLEEYEKFSWRLLDKEPIYAIMNINHALARKIKLKRSDLKNEHFVFLNRSVSHYGFDKMISCFVKSGYSPKIVKHCSSIETILLMVELGIGITLLPKSTSIPENYNLIHIPLEGSDEYVNSVLVWHDDNINPTIDLFLKSIDYR